MEEGFEGLSQSLSGLKRTFRSGKTRGVEWRKAQLRALLKFLAENEAQIFEALKQDLGKHPIGVVKKSADHALLHIQKWMAPKKGQLPLLLFPSRAQVLPEPLGTVLIFGSWNFPIIIDIDTIKTQYLQSGLTLDPVLGAISAGNTVVLKPSELAPTCSSLLKRTIPLYLDTEAVKVIEGGSDVAEQLLQQRWDKIFFTVSAFSLAVAGSPRVGRIIMSAAAKHLTPVTLELGGKCPVILDSFSGSDFKVAVKRIAGGKWGPCAGQACIGIDYVLVQQNLAPVLVESLKSCIKKFYGENVKTLQSICRIVNKHHFDRIRNLLEEPGVAASIVYGGSMDQDNFLYVIRCLFGGIGQSGFGRYHGNYSLDTFSHEKAVLHRTFFPEFEPRYPPWNDFKLDFIRLAYNLDYVGLLLLLLGLRRIFTPNRSR
ncbi:hypothetical protein DH2020_040556 [Rehmannia glutinosa]|uniref:Aldehyde dehydrogenase n=1 Tax=Rehmannia glutinosa TaxID=99300 RepID=A0ABR0UTA3_REHGL